MTNPYAVSISSISNAGRFAERGVAPARTYNIELETLKQIFTYAIEHGFVIESPAAALKRRRQPKAVISVPTKEQFKTLVDDLRQGQTKEAADFAECLAYSGCRQHEASEVVWHEVDFDRMTLTISGGIRGTKNGLVRVIPLFPPLARLLVAIRERTMPALQPKQRVFAISDIRTALANACRRLGFPKWGHHAFRHFFASNAVEAGVDFYDSRRLARSSRRWSIAGADVFASEGGAFDRDGAAGDFRCGGCDYQSVTTRPSDLSAAEREADGFAGRAL